MLVMPEWAMGFALDTTIRLLLCDHRNVLYARIAGCRVKTSIMEREVKEDVEYWDRCGEK